MEQKKQSVVSASASVQEENVEAEPKVNNVNEIDNEANNSTNVDSVIDNDKGSTESEESDEEPSECQLRFEAESEFSEITPEEQLMEMAILKNF